MTRISILMYHRITDSSSMIGKEYPSIGQLHLKTFEDQVYKLREHGFTSVFYDDLRSHILSGHGLPDKPIIFTFDDAYQSTYIFARPVLSACGYSGIVHVPTKYVGKNSEERQTSLWNAGLDAAWHMTWDELRDLHHMGWSIQSHGVTHSHPSVLSYADKELEAKVSQSIIQSEIGVIPRYYCYPFGVYDPEMDGILQRNGYLGSVVAKGRVKSKIDGGVPCFRRIPVMNLWTADNLLRQIRKGCRDKYCFTNTESA